MEKIDEAAIRNHAPLPNPQECGSELLRGLSPRVHAVKGRLPKGHNVEIQYEEWAALLFGALGANLESYRERVVRWRSGETTDMFLVPGYPMLSRLNDNLVDVGFTHDEVKALQQEALNLINKPINEPARNLLRVILAICNEAQRHNLAIYLLAP